MNLDIEIEGIEISDTIKNKFLESFLSNLTGMNSSNINNRICESLTNILTNKPTDLLTGYTKVDKQDTDITCYICQEKLKECEYKRTLICDHIFHKKCIDKWINVYKKTTCPNCRENIFSTVHQQISSQILHQ